MLAAASAGGVSLHRQPERFPASPSLPASSSPTPKYDISTLKYSSEREQHEGKGVLVACEGRVECCLLFRQFESVEFGVEGDGAGGLDIGRVYADKPAGVGQAYLDELVGA